jgi:hypothetical protein
VSDSLCVVLFMAELALTPTLSINAGENLGLHKNQVAVIRRAEKKARLEGLLNSVSCKPAGGAVPSPSLGPTRYTAP